MRLLSKWFMALLASGILALGSGLALAADENKSADADDANMQQRSQTAVESQDQSQQELKAAEEDVQEAVAVFRKVQMESGLAQHMEKAKGIFIVPDYATAALIIGGAGGEGVLVTKNEGGEWGNPAFYNIGQISAGLQAGAAAGSIALLLMSDKSLEAFKDENNFSLTSAAGYSIINYSDRAQGELGGEGNDVIAWTETEGLFGELSVAITDINWDEEENREYYGQSATPQQVLSGDISSPRGQEFSQVEIDQQQTESPTP